MIRTSHRLISRDKRRTSIIQHKVELRIEELERRYLLFASPADPPNIIPSATPLTAVQVLGQNALPATDVLGTGMTFNNAIPWVTSQGGMSTLSQSLGGVSMRTEALGAEALGSLNPFSRASHSFVEIPPQQVQPPSREDASAAYHLEDAIDSVARATTARFVDARDAAIVAMV